MQRETIEKVVKIGLIGLAGLLVSPIIYLTIKGIIGLAIAALTGVAIVSFAPWVAMKFANWKVAAIAHEAKENPIETMTNLLIAKQQAFETLADRVEDAVTARKNFAAKCAEFAKKYPARAEEFQKQLDAMTTVVDRKKQALANASKMLQEGQVKLEEMKAYWEMSMAAQEAHAATGLDTGDLFEKLKADTAVDAVFSSMNRAFAQLEVAAHLDNTDNNSVQLMELTAHTSQQVPLTIDQKVKV